MSCSCYLVDLENFDFSPCLISDPIFVVTKTVCFMFLYAIMNYSATCWQLLWEEFGISPLKSAGMLAFIIINTHSHWKFSFCFPAPKNRLFVFICCRRAIKQNSSQVYCTALKVFLRRHRHADLWNRPLL